MMKKLDSSVYSGSKEVVIHIWIVLSFILALLIVGVLGFSLIEGWTFIDSLYMTVITVTTVGFSEVKTLSSAGKIFTIFLIIGGVGTWAYALGSFSKLLIEGDIRDFIITRRLKKMINTISGHTILCGYGRIGRMVAQELSEGGSSFVVIEKNPDLKEEFEKSGWLYLIGDATEEEIMISAGIKSARCLITALGTDESNVYTVLIARDLNRSLYIVGRGEDKSSEDKILRAGADKVVSPYKVGARSLAQAVMRPNVLNFIELATTNSLNFELALEEVPINGDSPFLNKTLKEARIRELFGIIVIASHKNTNEMEFNLNADYRIVDGEVLIVMGKGEGLKNFRKAVSG